MVVFAFAGLLAPVHPAGAQTRQPPVTNLLLTPGDGSLTVTWSPPTTFSYSGGQIDIIEEDADPETPGVQTNVAQPRSVGPRQGRNSWSSREFGAGRHTISGLTNGTAYIVRVRVVYTGNRFSSWVRATGTPNVPPPAPTLVTLASSSATVAEGGSVTVTATLDNAAHTGGVRVNLRREGASDAALTAGDFTLPAQFTVAEGETVATAEVQITDDDFDEDDEKFIIGGNASTLLGQGIAVTPTTITITDDDTAGTTFRETDNVVIPADGYTTYAFKLNSRPTAAGDGHADSQRPVQGDH